jgi:hypothetical protein
MIYQKVLIYICNSQRLIRITLTLNKTWIMEEPLPDYAEFFVFSCLFGPRNFRSYLIAINHYILIYSEAINALVKYFKI